MSALHKKAWLRGGLLYLSLLAPAAAWAQDSCPPEGTDASSLALLKETGFAVDDDTRRTLAPGGVLLINLILDSQLQSAYARNLLATIESVYGRCGVEVLHKTRPQSNVIVSCHASGHLNPGTPYTDERNTADLDMANAL